ncbi:MAG: sulfatase [Bacteroidota bacterium]
MSFHQRLLILSATIFCLLSTCQEESEQAAPYNVLFIAIDDLRPELNCYGAEHIHSPNIDRLAASGVRFTNAHVQQAICMASRASILSGLRPERYGIYTGEPIEDLIPDITTLNECFQEQGYTIASAGKIYHYKDDTKQQFGEGLMLPEPTWTNRGYVTEKAIAKIALNPEFKRGPAYENADTHDTLYRDGINTLNAVRKLNELKAEERPFFLAVGLYKPHLPFAAPKKYWDMYPESSITLPAIRKMPENANLHTMRIKGELTNYQGIPASYAEIDDSTTLTLRRAYYACVSYVDAQVGLLLDQLEILGLAENTVVVLWGDHGFKLGDYGNWCKWSNMDVDTHIPLIFSVPGGNQDAIATQPVEALDIYPTLVELCGLKAPDHLEGKSLVPLLNNPGFESDDEDYAYSIWPNNRQNYDKTVMGYSIKDQRYNYVEWVQLNNREVFERELYDHQIDPNETRNMVDDEQYEAVISKLSRKLKERKNTTDHDHGFKALR